jgi:hypothetical protein
MKKRIIISTISILLSVLFLQCGNTQRTNLNIKTVTLATIYNTEQIEAYGTTYYSFQVPLTTNYTISITNITSGADISWGLFEYVSEYYEDYIYPSIDGCNNHTNDVSPPSNGDEIKSVALTAGHAYLLIVDEWNHINTTFTLQIN